MRVLSLFILTLLCSAMLNPVAAQSGRRLPNQTNRPAPPTANKVEAEKPDPSRSQQSNDQNKTSILIALDTPNLNIPGYYVSLVGTSFADRLQESGAAKVQIGQEMTRKEATDFARNSNDVYVVLLQLENDPIRSGNSDWNGANQDPRALVINYTMFEPKTGKSRATGRTYPRAASTNPRSIPQTVQAADYRLKLAAEEAADRILKTLGL